MFFSICLAPRTVSYINDSLATYPKDIGKVIFAEPGSPDITHPNIQVIKNSKKFGCCANFLQSLIHAYYENHDWVVFCEDDIKWEDWAFTKLLEIIEHVGDDKHIGMVSPYCSIPNGPEPNCPDPPMGWIHPRYDRIAAGLCGALCCAMPKHAIRKLGNNIKLFEKLANDKLKDFALGESLRRLGYDILVHTPSLITHLGEYSTLVPDGHKFHAAPARQAWLSS